MTALTHTWYMLHLPKLLTEVGWQCLAAHGQSRELNVGACSPALLSRKPGGEPAATDLTATRAQRPASLRSPHSAVTITNLVSRKGLTMLKIKWTPSEFAPVVTAGAGMAWPAGV